MVIVQQFKDLLEKNSFHMYQLSQIVISFIKFFLNRLIYLLARLVLFSISSFWKHKCAIRLIWFFINDFSFCTSWRFPGYLNNGCCLSWVGFFRNIWISTHWFEKAINSLFLQKKNSLYIQYWQHFHYYNFSFRMNKFSLHCLMNEKVLLINGVRFSQS